MEARTLPVIPGRRECRCVKNHNPDARVVHSHHIHPLGHGGPDTQANRVWLCPTGHYNVHWMLDHMLKHNGVKPIGRQNDYLLQLARRGYDAIQAAA